MLKPKQMSRVMLVGHKDYLEPTIEVMHDMHVVHIEEYTRSIKISKGAEGIAPQ